jgi:DNA-binding NarL/FixJ family response regulator
VAIVFDRYPLFLDAVETILRGTGITIAAKTTTADEALELIAEHDADLLVAGIEGASEAEDVIALVREADARRPGLKAIVLSASAEAGLVGDAFDAGAAAFVARNGSADDVEFAIRQTYEPSIHFAPRRTPSGARSADGSGPGMTERELEILQLVSRGLSNAEVGRKLWVTEQTVKFHLSNIFRKLDVSNRTQASRRAQQLNLLSDDGPDDVALAGGSPGRPTG